LRTNINYSAVSLNGRPYLLRTALYDLYGAFFPYAALALVSSATLPGALGFALVPEVICCGFDMFIN
jgi:hypothetical protein